jgi:hypothetical protein
MTIQTTKDLPTLEAAVASSDLVVKDQKCKRGITALSASELSRNDCNKLNLNK